MNFRKTKLSYKLTLRIILLILLIIVFSMFKFDLGIIIVYGVFLWLFFSDTKNLFIKYVYLIVFTTWNVISVWSIENFGISVPNLQINSAEHVGALPLLVIANMFFWCTVLFLEKDYDNKSIKSIRFHNQNDYMRIFIGTFLVVLVLFVADISRHSFFFSGVTTRYEFVNTVKSISLSLSGWIIYFIPAAAIYSLSKNNKKVIYVISGLYFIYLVLAGTKFGAFVQLFYIVIISDFFCETIRTSHKVDRKKLALIIIAAVFVLICYSLIHYYIKLGNVSLALIELNNRLLNGQGDVWWGTYRLCKKSGFHIGELADEFSAFTNTSDNQYTYNFGIYKMMRLIAPDVVVRRYADQGIRFTMSTDASIYYYFGPVGLVIIKMFFAFLTFIAVNGLINAVMSYKPISSILYCYLLIQLHIMLTMSDFAILFRRTSLFAITMLILIRFFENNMISRLRMINRRINNENI